MGLCVRSAVGLPENDQERTEQTSRVLVKSVCQTAAAAVRVALFITCFNDTLFPATGRAAVELLERLGCEVVFPEAQTCCGQMHGNTGYAEHGERAGRRWERVFADYEVVVSPSASCVGYVREHVPSSAGRLFELTEFLVDRLGVTDVGASFPHRVTLHPTCHSLRMLHVGDRPRRLLSAVRGIDLVDLPDARRVLRLRRHVRGQERRHLDGDAARQAAAGARHARGGVHGGGQLVPDAHRRRAAPAAGRGAHDAPGRDPGGDRVKGFPAAARETLQNAQLRRNLGKATTTIREKRLRAVGELPDWEALRDAGAAIKARAMATLPGAARAARGVGDARPAGPCTGRATAPRRTRSWPAWRARTARAR